MGRPVIKETSARKVFRYFLGDNWEQEHDCVELAVRHGKIGEFDDELIVYNKKKQEFRTFNWNADPSMHARGAKELAILRTGVHFYKISYHHIWKDAKRYVALRPDTPNNELPVCRINRKTGEVYFSIGIALNQHAGGEIGTGSDGCQTAPKSQYAELITFIGDAFGVKVPLGLQVKAKKEFLDGIGRIPYLLVTQEQFNYITRLKISEFDSAADLKYQIANFVGVPKIERVVPEPKAAPEQTPFEINQDLTADASLTQNGVDQFPPTLPADNAQPSDNLDPAQASGKENIVIEKPVRVKLWDYLKGKFTALLGGNVGWAIMVDKVQQFQALALSQQMVSALITLAIVGSIVAIATWVFTWWREEKAKDRQTDRLVEANSTPENIVHFAPATDLDAWKEWGAVVVRR